MKALLEELFCRYHRDVYLYLFSLSHNADLAEEMTAETFLEVVRCVRNFRGDSDVKTWIFTIARRRWIAALRKKQQQPEFVLIDELLESGDPTPERRALDQAALERVRALLELEPERTREIIQMRLSGYSFYEIGRQCGVSESSARVIDFRAKEKIRKILKKEGLTDG